MILYHVILYQQCPAHSQIKGMTHGFIWDQDLALEGLTGAEVNWEVLHGPSA